MSKTEFYLSCFKSSQQTEIDKELVRAFETDTGERISSPLGKQFVAFVNGMETAGKLLEAVKKA